MSNESPEIKIVGVQKETIKVSSDKEDFWVIPFKLSLIPDKVWEKKFFDVQQRDDDDMKRKTRIVNDSLEVEVFEDDDLQKILDVVKGEIAEANAQCEEDYQKKLKIRRDVEELRQRQTKATQKFKDETDKLTF